MNREMLAAQLAIDEGRRLVPYLDTVGKITVGVGRNLSDRRFSADEIVAGCSLGLPGFTDAQVDLMLSNDIVIVEKALDYNLPWWRARKEQCQQVMANMCFNLGVNRFLGFKNTIKAMQERRYHDAAAAMLDSTWAKQVGPRAMRLAKLIVEGKENGQS